MADHPTEAQRMERWRRDFRAKPGQSGPICSACGDAWPCEYFRDNPEELAIPEPSDA